VDQILSIVKETKDKEIEEQIMAFKEEIDSLQKENRKLEREIESTESEKEDLEEEIEAGKPKTMYGVLKDEIIDKIRQLPLDVLQKIELDYCGTILGIERRDD
jgi:predicted RNase H-like nuclease (RuvC/YqgF family)